MCCFHLFYMFLLLSWGDREKEEKRFLIVLLFNRDLSPLKVRTKFSFHCVRTAALRSCSWKRFNVSFCPDNRIRK